MSKDKNLLPRISYSSHRTIKKSSRRLFIADFLIVIAVLACILYYFWPSMLEVPEPVVPDIVVRDVVGKFIQVQKDFELAVIQAKQGVRSVEDAFKSKLFPYQSSIDTAPHIMVWIPSGNVIFGENFWPQGWNQQNPPWSKNPNGIIIDRSTETNQMMIVYKLPDSDYHLITFKSFNSVLSEHSEEEEK